MSSRFTGRAGPLRGLAVALAVATPVVAVVASLLVLALTEAQRDAFESSAVDEARTVLLLVPDDVDGPTAQQLSRNLRQPDAREVVVVASDGTVARSSRSVTLADVPPPVQGDATTPVSARTEVAGQPVLVVGGPTRPGASRVYLFFSERPLEEERRGTVSSVALGSLLVLALVAGAGWWRSDRRARALDASGAQERAFMAHLAHELRTPVGALVTAASLVDTSRLTDVPEQLRQPLETMLVQARRLRTIVEDLLELSRLEAGHLELRLEAVDLEQVVTEIVSGYGWYDVQVETSGPTLVEADRQSLTRLALNLVANARDHAGGRVEVTVRGTPDDVVLEVADDGPGLDPEQARVLTHPDRPRTSRPGPGGHGLGLLITRAHADLLGAGIDVDSGHGRGTRIRVHLRAADIEAPRQPAPLR